MKQTIELNKWRTTLFATTIVRGILEQTQTFIASQNLHIRCEMPTIHLFFIFSLVHNNRKMHWTKKRDERTYTCRGNTLNWASGMHCATMREKIKPKSEMNFTIGRSRAQLCRLKMYTHSVPPTTRRRTKTTATSVRKVRANEQQNRLRKNNNNNNNG